MNVDSGSSKTPIPFEILDGQNENSTTFIFGNEDHTFGNTLRYILMQKSATEFCGYSVPHPYEPKLNLRLQTHETPTVDVLLSGLIDMSDSCDLIEDAFERALRKFHRP